MSQYTRFPDPAGGIKIYPSVTDFPADPGRDGVQAVAADTNTIYIYDTSIPGWTPVANPGAAIAIDGLMADVSATGPGVVNATVNSVGGASAADVATSVSDTQAATNAATPNTLVKRDLNSQITLKALNLDGATSGTINIYPAAVTTNYTVNLPAAQGAASSVLQNDGAGNLSWSVLPTPVTSVSGSAPIASSGGTTPTISISNFGGATSLLPGSNGAVPAPAAGDQTKYLRADATWQTIISGVTSVSGVAPIASSGGATPAISISQSGVAADGYLSSTDWNTFNNKQDALVSGTNIKTVSGNSLLGSGDVGTIGIGYGGTGQTTANAAFNALVPTQTSNSGKYLQTDGTNTSWQTVPSFPAYSQDKVLYSTASAAEWRTVGLGSSDSSYPSNTIILGRALPSGMTATSGILIGTGSNLGTGTSQVIIGASSGRSTTGATGANNTVVGADSFNNASLTTAYENTIIGQATATAVTTGFRNSIVGQNAALELTTGFENTVLGYYAGTTSSGAGITTGNENVCIGARAALSSGGVINATAVGFKAKAAYLAVAIGSQCYEINTGSTSVGANCAQWTGDYTVRVGYAVGGSTFGPIGGARSVFVGALTNGTQVSPGYTSNDDCIFIGYSAGSRSLSTSNELFIDNQDRASYAGQQTKSLIYGVFNATETSQTLRLNAQTQLAYGEKHASLHGQVGTANVITAAVNNYYIGVDSTLAAKTVNLPAAATAGQGFVLVIKDESGTAETNAITIDANGAELIDGALTQTIAANYGSLSLMCSGSAWFIM